MVELSDTVHQKYTDASIPSLEAPNSLIAIGTDPFAIIPLEIVNLLKALIVESIQDL